jgi:hypothetical protein
MKVECMMDGTQSECVVFICAKLQKSRSKMLEIFKTVKDQNNVDLLFKHHTFYMEVLKGLINAMRGK